MSGFKPAYLVSGDDDAKIDLWRARLRVRAESERGPGALESFDARQGGPADVAAALSVLSFDPGTRYLLVDDAGAWKAGELGPLEDAMGELADDTVLVLIVRGKPAKQLVKAVESAGGELREYTAPKPWELPKWCVARGQELGLRVDQEAAKELVARVGTGQQRLSRELEKIALAVHPAQSVSLSDVEANAAGDTSPQVYALADALVAGDLRLTLTLAEGLEASGERPGRLMFPIVRRLREVHRAATLLEAGASDQQAAESLKAPPWLAKKTVARAKKADATALARALCVFAELEVQLRGGSERQLSEDTAFSLALARAAG